MVLVVEYRDHLALPIWKKGSFKLEEDNKTDIFHFLLGFRPTQSKKSRPNSANSGIVPVYKKLRPVQDPIIQILDQIHKILFIAQVKLLNIY